MNKQQKEFKSFYSIRKSSLGVASVAISTLLLLMSNGEAQAAAEETGGTNGRRQHKNLKQLQVQQQHLKKLQKLNQ